MKKGKSITLLSILSFILACLLVITFVRFEVGVYNFNSVLGAIELDYDISGGSTYVATLAKDNIEEVGDNIDDVIKTVENRMTALGYSAFSVRAAKSVEEGVEDYDLIISARASLNEKNLENVAILEQDINVAIAFGELKFFGDAEADPGEDKQILKDMKVIADAKVDEAIYDGETVYYPVKITFTNEAYDKLMELLEENSNSYYLKVMLGDTVLLDASQESQSLSASYFDGKSLQMSPTDEALARQIALQIKSGGLAYKYEVSEVYEVNAPLGENTGLIITIATIVMLVAIMVALILLYKMYGVAFSLSLLAFMCLEVLMLIAVPGIKLSLGGVVGILLSTVVVCDGFIITIKRIKEEFEKGKTLKSAIKVGYNRSLLPVISVGVICGLVALSIFAFASGSLKCFGITFGIGAVLGVITNLLFTRMFAAILLPLANFNESAVNFKRVEE